MTGRSGFVLGWHRRVVLANEGAEGVSQLLQELGVPLEQRLREDDVVIAEQGLVDLGEIVREVALQREGRAELAAHVEQEDSAVVREQHVREDRVAVDDVDRLPPGEGRG